MGKRLRRNTEDLDASTAHNNEPVLASSISIYKPNDKDDTEQPTKYGNFMARNANRHGVAIRCTLPPHQPMSFLTQSDFETHYHKNHANRCSACGKNFPTEHYMNLHIAENHDPINEVLKQNQGRIVLLHIF